MEGRQHGKEDGNEKTVRRGRRMRFPTQKAIELAEAQQSEAPHQPGNLLYDMDEFVGMNQAQQIAMPKLTAAGLLTEEHFAIYPSWIPRPKDFLNLSPSEKQTKERLDAMEADQDRQRADGADEFYNVNSNFDMRTVGSMFVKRAKRACRGKNTWEAYAAHEVSKVTYDWRVAKSLDPQGFMRNSFRLQVWHGLKKRLCEEIWNQAFVDVPVPAEVQNENENDMQEYTAYLAAKLLDENQAAGARMCQQDPAAAMQNAFLAGKPVPPGQPGRILHRSNNHVGQIHTARNTISLNPGGFTCAGPARGPVGGTGAYGNNNANQRFDSHQPLLPPLVPGGQARSIAEQVPIDPTLQEMAGGILGWSGTPDGAGQPYYAGETEAPNGMAQFLQAMRLHEQVQAASQTLDGEAGINSMVSQQAPWLEGLPESVQQDTDANAQFELPSLLGFGADIDEEELP